jgi:ribosomal protein S27AE
VKVALCPRCGDVLVSTMAWRRKEFVCLSCGSLWEWLQPRAGDETPDHLARIEETKAEWKILSEGLLSEPHLRHASAEEIAAHETAVARIGERLGRVPS